MADNPITTPLPADLPTDWVYGQTIGPQGTDVGLARQYGYNYLMQQVNAAQLAATQIGQAFSGLPSLGADGKIPAEQLPEMKFDPSGSAAAVQKNLDAHTGNKNNPHAVTAAQVGADRAGSAAAVQTSLSAHTGNRNNPHAVTAAQAGADPAGSAEAVRSALASQIAALTTQLGGKAEIHTFSYVGTGTGGSANPNSLTAEKPIQFASILFGSNGHYTANGECIFMLANSLTTNPVEGRGFGAEEPFGYKSSDGKTFYWYNTYDRGDPYYQYNKSGTTYYGFYIC